MSDDEKKLKDKINGRNVAIEFINLYNELKNVDDWSPSIRIEVLLERMEDIFDDHVWREIDKVYETRYDCCTERLMTAVA